MAKVLEDRPDVGQVSVETGQGWIAEVAEPQGRNAKVTMRADHLNDPVSAWVDTTNGDLYDLVRRACSEGRRISYRVVVKRKKGEPTDVPLAEIGTRQRIRDLEAVELAGAVTGPPPSVPDSAPAPTAASGSPSDALICGNCGGDLRGSGPVRSVNGVPQHVTCPGKSSAPADDDAPPVDPAPPTAEPPQRRTTNGARVQEAKPWEFYNSDGSLNPGSYAYQAAEGIVLLANDLLFAHAREVDSAAGFKAPTEGQIRSLARRLLRAADGAQANLRDDGHVSRMAASHTRVRAAVRASLESYPVPWGGSADVLDAWEANLVDHAGILLRLTVELVDPDAPK